MTQPTTALTRLAQELASQDDVRGALGLAGQLTVDAVTEAAWQLFAHRDQTTNLIAVLYHLAKVEAFAGKNKPWLAWGMQFRDVSDRQCYTYAKAGELIWEHVGEYPLLQYLDLGKLEILHSLHGKSAMAFHNLMSDPTVRLGERSFTRKALRDAAAQWLEGKALEDGEDEPPKKAVPPAPWEKLRAVKKPETLRQVDELQLARARLHRLTLAVQAQQTWDMSDEDRLGAATELEQMAALLRSE